jgi:hypothetical protein
MLRPFVFVCPPDSMTGGGFRHLAFCSGPGKGRFDLGQLPEIRPLIRVKASASIRA